MENKPHTLLVAAATLGVYLFIEKMGIWLLIQKGIESFLTVQTILPPK